MRLFGKKKAAADGAEAAVPHAPSATELALIAERETTSAAHKNALKAEKQYRIRRKAARARTEYTASKTHIKNSYKELRLGTKAWFVAMSLLHFRFREKISTNPEDKQKRKLERTASRKQKLEEKMKKWEGEAAKKDEEAPAAEE